MPTKQLSVCAMFCGNHLSALNVTDKPKHGGQRSNAGRKPSPNPATKLATIKMTPEQHARFIALGGSRWLKGLLDKSAGNG